MAPVLVNNQPKAGTFLYNEIISALGFEPTHIHLGRNGLQAYDKLKSKHAWHDAQSYSINIPLEESIKLIRSYQIATSHFTYNAKTAELLNEFKIITVRRELRAGLMSFAKMYADSAKRQIRAPSTLKVSISENGYLPFLQASGERYIKRSLKIFEWVNRHNVLALAFEDLKSNPAKQIQAISSFLNVEGELDYNQIYKDCLLSSTLTKTSVAFPHSWGDPEERWFEKVGGVEANQKLGYDL